MKCGHAAVVFNCEGHLGRRDLFPSRSAAELLAEFRASGRQEPFEEIVRRYAGMVYSVALRVTRDTHDAEDATQAVFLSLALQAKTGRAITYPGPWLQRVAHRLALDIKKTNSRRKKRLDQLAEAGGNGRFMQAVDPLVTTNSEEVKRLISEELSALPAKYRMPLILHYFGGLSREEMSRELGCNPATLGVRVHRGKAMLGKRLARRGVALGAAVLGLALHEVVRATVARPMIAQTASAASGMYVSSAAGAQLASARVIALARIAARAVALARLKVAVGIILLSTLISLAGPAVVNKVRALKLDLHLPDISWLRPLMRMTLPQQRVESTPPQKRVHVAVNAPRSPVRAQKPEPVRSLALSSNEQSASTAAGKVIEAKRVEPAPAQSRSQIQPLSPIELPVAVGAAKPAGAQTAQTTAAAPPASNDPAQEPQTVSASTAGAGGGFSLGGGGGSNESFTLPANRTLRAGSEVIGGSGFAYFHQNGGSNTVDRELVLGRDARGRAQYDLTAGKLSAPSEIVGDAGSAVVHQSGGTNRTRKLVLGAKPSGHGTYLLDGTGSLTGRDVIVGGAGTGLINQDGGTIVVSSESLTQASSTDASSSAAATTPSAFLAAALPAVEGDFTDSSGAGDSAGPVPADAVEGQPPSMVALGSQSSGSGTFSLTSGKLLFQSGNGRPTLKIGAGGSGDFQLGSDDKTGEISESPLARASLIIRDKPSAEGKLSGWGQVGLTGALVNNGEVIADGFDEQRTLDLSQFTRVRNRLDNPADGGTHGWFVRRGGELRLPPVPIHAGAGTYTWGEDRSDSVIDLINSVRFTAHGATYPGEVSIALVDQERAGIPTLPLGHHFIGIWSFNPSDVAAEGGWDITVRYDDLLARSEGISESVLKLWRFSGDSWYRINDESFGRDEINHLIWGHAPDLSYFAVSAPEPGTMGGLVLGVGLCMMKRWRRR
jgi:RNA polymerase sigma factor (sigma-70 family)